MGTWFSASPCPAPIYFPDRFLDLIVSQAFHYVPATECDRATFRRSRHTPHRESDICVFNKEWIGLRAEFERSLRGGDVVNGDPDVTPVVV